MDRDIAREELKGRLKEYVETITEKSKGKNMYNCPLCPSGTGAKGTGAFSIKDSTSWKCFSCGKSGDIFDLIGEVEHISDYNEQLKRAGELFGITIDSYRSSAQEDFRPQKTRAEYQKQDRSERYTHTHSSIHTYTQEGEAPDAQPNFRDFFLQAYKHIAETDYPQRRGLSQEIIDRYKLGYIAEWKHPKAPKAPATPRLIIPISDYSYLARDIRADIPKEQEDYKKSKVKGRDKVIWTFNYKALQAAAKPIFVVEGEIDALSIIEVGGEAVALGSIVNIRPFLELLKEEKPAHILILALDNEKEPAKIEKIEGAYKELAEGLTKEGIPYCRLNPAGEHKDANEALTADRESFKRAVAEAIEQAQSIEDREEAEKREEYLKNSTANYIQSFIDGIAESVNTSYIPTGFEKLDEALDGGLYEGLYIIGAISSLGKTTFILQMVDQIAASGQDVIIFSLEMARAELMSKSISRNTMILTVNNGGDMRNAKTARGITTGTRYTNYNPTERKLIQEAIEAYKDYSENIYIYEGVGNIGVTEIRDTVQKHIRFTGKKPVIVVDYLQILAPYNERATDKQNTDKAVTELKRLSRDYKIPVIGISSFNRDNYTAPVNMASFKESGAIEYSSDVLFGLQIEGMDYREGEKDGDRQKRIRKLFKDTDQQGKNGEAQSLELKVLKNRNGSKGHKIPLSFYPFFNYFQET